MRMIAVSFVLFALLAAGSGAGAQHRPRQEEISEGLLTLVRDRWETIRLEASGLPGDEWAGDYRAFGGPTISTHLAWSPASGFVVWWENCSRPQFARVNYGRAAFTDGSLKLAPELSEQSPSAFHVGSELVPVKWGEQHFLIPADRMVNFAYAANSGSVEQVESFLLKTADYEKERKGLPDLPPEYRKHLGARPITATLSGFGAKEERRPLKVFLNAGRAEGVVPEMTFYLSRPRNVYMQIEVTDVREHTSEAFVIMVRYTDNREDEVRPKVGWKFTSRVPAGDSHFLP